LKGDILRLENDSEEECESMDKIIFKQQGQQKGYFPTFNYSDGISESVEIREPVQVAYLDGCEQAMDYTSVERDGSKWNAECSWDFDGYHFHVRDLWEEQGEHIIVKRKLSANREKKELKDSSYCNGIQMQLSISKAGHENDAWRFCAPATMYTQSESLKNQVVRKVYMDDRLTYPFIIGYKPDDKCYLSLARILLPSKTEAPRRKDKENRFLQKTEVGSVGYSVKENADIVLHAYWPYFEGDRSVALNSQLTPITAYYPLEEDSFTFDFKYEITMGRSDNFADAIFSVFSRNAELQIPEPYRLPFSLEDSMDFRMESLMDSYRDLEKEGGGFFFHFDPRNGYFSEPSGFGASFINIPHKTYTSILEYGFTGRQLNAAYSLAKQYGAEWWERGKRVIDFFVERCMLQNGWMYSLYDLNKEEPFYSFGDPEAPKLHYVSHGEVRGNYLRCMVEPAYDLLLNYQLHRSQGREESKWIQGCHDFAGFLVRHQNQDGSWYRAFEPNGEPLRDSESFGMDEFAAKSASSIPIPYLIALGKENRAYQDIYFQAAQKAGDFVLSTYVEDDYYMGGTLDNPNVVDKESAQYAMAALLALYELTGERKYLIGSERAANIFVSWNYIWNAPTLPGTDLDHVGFKTVGMGGINSIWGGGVVDIYSLFHLYELDRLGLLTNKPFYRKMAEWIAIGTQQLLSHPQDKMGFTDIGMQPEGFAVCNQGIDMGMIAKGDIWGTLGWIYSAGIFGLGRYVDGKASLVNE
jgi:hypothetical protein